MKRMFFMLFPLSVCVLSAQAYMPLVRENVKWVFLFNDVTDSPDLYPEWYDEEDFEPDKVIYGNGFEFYTLEFKGDSVFNGKVYKKLYCSFDTVYSVPVALMREENQCVYALQCSNVNQLGKKYHFTPEIGGNFELGETLLYDFAHPETMASWTESEYVLNHNTHLAGEMVTAYDIKSGELIGAKMVEGVGIDCYAVDLMSFPVRDDIFTCVCPQRKGLVKMEDANGNIIYKGLAFHADGTLPGDKTVDGKIDVSDVNSVIDVVLLGQGYDPVADMNSDGIIDVSDVNALIDIILGK